MNNADMPAAPIWDVELQRCNGLAEEDSIGLTKLEHFAGLAPVMPVWFEIKFCNGEIEPIIKIIEFSVIDLTSMAFMAWPVYYAKALLKQLEGESNE